MKRVDKAASIVMAGVAAACWRVRHAMLLGLLLCQPRLASAIGSPSTGAISLFPGARSLTYCWVPDTSQGVPTGYLYSLRRCTAVDGIASEVCNEGYELVARAGRINYKRPVFARLAARSCLPPEPRRAGMMMLAAFWGMAATS